MGCFAVGVAVQVVLRFVGSMVVVSFMGVSGSSEQAGLCVGMLDLFVEPLRIA